MRLRELAIGVAVVTALSTTAAAQQPAPVNIPTLGSITFEVSTTSAEARTSFLRGTLLLHVFHYKEAIAAFRAAQQLDPGMTMAWWGEALASNYPVWNIQFPDSARAALARLAPSAAARAAKARTPREREYLATIEILYGDGAKAHRDTLYATAMAKLSAHYPKDDEARLFYALALLGLNQGVRDTATYRRAYLLANDVFVRHPDHPGASHYVIHATDDPDHADAGLPAARALARSSPGADHAQHMTSHIFMARGMWDDLVTANERATHRDAAGHAMPGMTGSSCGHYNAWLEYGYLAQGRFAKADTLLQGCQQQAVRTPGTLRPGENDPDASRLFSAIAMWSRYLIDTEDWSGPQSRWTPVIGDAPAPLLTWHFAHGFAAARRGDTIAARADLAALQAANRVAAADAAKRGDTDPEAIEAAKRAQVLDLELQAAIHSRAGRHDAAMVLLREAVTISAGMAYAFGPPLIDKPPLELAGEELLQLGLAREAKIAFERALLATPNRPLAMRGLAEATARGEKAP
jgi:tetratricopeptide (TPR) repeat protein